MATFRGIVSDSISFAISTYTFKNVKAKQVAGGTMVLPYPGGPLWADTIRHEFIQQVADLNRPTKLTASTIIGVHANIQRGNRHAREKNLGKAPYDGMGVGFDWFERIHVTPKRLDLGNVVSNILKELELYSAYRYDNRQWTVFTNNAGAGITILNLPTLPKTIVKQTSFVVSVQITPNGPPTINGTLDFIFDVTTASVAITGTRIILYGFAPTGAVTEKLSWKTDVLRAGDGTEQRVSVRRYPRQEIEFESLLPRDFDRTEFNAFLFDWHSRVFGVPLWWDARKLTQNATIGDTTLYITSTDYADFRAGGLAVVIAYDADGNRTADTLEITSVSSSPAAITFTSSIQNAYTAGQAVVVPVVPGILGSTVKRSRFAAGQQKVTMSFLSVDNAARADGSWISTFNNWRGRPVIEDLNFIDRQIQENFVKVLKRIDGDTGEIVQTAIEDRSTPTSHKRWNPETAQRSWEIRNLLYALRGRQASFFMPTQGDDIALAASVGAGAANIDVTNFGYTQFMKSREPFTSLVIRFDPNNPPTIPSPIPLAGSPLNYVDGQLYLFVDIMASTEVSDTVDRISITPPIPLSFSAANVESIQFMIKSRFDSDTVELLHKWTDLMGDEIDSEINVAISGVYDV